MKYIHCKECGWDHVHPYHQDVVQRMKRKRNHLYCKCGGKLT